MKCLKIKDFSYSLHIKFTSERAHFFSIVFFPVWLQQRDGLGHEPGVCCVYFPAWLSKCVLCVQESLQSPPHLQRWLCHKRAERGVPASFILKTLLLRPNLINELCVVSDKLCTGFIDWEGF